MDTFSVKSEAFFFILDLKLGTVNLENRDLFLRSLTEIPLCSTILSYRNKTKQ